MHWPAHYPEQCPPQEAYSYNGEVFRFINRSTPAVKDFISYYERSPSKAWSEPCQARGLSVLNCLVGLKEMRKSIPALRRKSICKAEMSHNDGLLANTPSNSSARHKTWWVPLSVDPIDLFEPFDDSELKNV